MGSAWDTEDQETKKPRSFPVFRFRRSSSPKSRKQSSPFTVMPEEFKRKPVPFGNLARGFFSVLFLLILGLALIGLVVAFEYQMVNNPKMMEMWSRDLINSVLNFFQALVASVK